MFSTLVLVAGCGGEATNTEPTGADTTSLSTTRTTTSTTPTTTVERSPETDTAAPDAPAAADPAAAGPTLVECIYGGGAWTGSGWLSGGSPALHPHCEALRSEQMAKNPYRCPRTDHYVADLSECASPNHVSIPTEPQNPSEVEKPEEAVVPVEPPGEPAVEPESDEAPEVDLCETGDTSEACQE